MNSNMILEDFKLSMAGYVGNENYPIQVLESILNEHGQKEYKSGYVPEVCIDCINLFSEGGKYFCGLIYNVPSNCVIDIPDFGSDKCKHGVDPDTCCVCNPEIFPIENIEEENIS